MFPVRVHQPRWEAAEGGMSCAVDSSRSSGLVDSYLRKIAVEWRRSVRQLPPVHGPDRTSGVRGAIFITVSLSGTRKDASAF
jgi:hypothetical protein